ncbi:MAG: SMC-Scp complex subunit ScpB [Candidatus Omnitrophota bacterium]
MDIQKIKQIIEALLIVSEGGIAKEELQKAIGEDVDIRDLDEAIRLLKEEYDSDTRAFNIAEIAGRYRVVTKPKYMPWINRLYRKEPERLTGPSLETLAIIAYKQPITRAEIEGVRGVNVGGVLKTLLDRELIQINGRKDVVGKPLIYGTSEGFLEIFGLNSLEDLPGLVDFSEEDLEYSKTKEHAVVENEEANEPTKEISDEAETTEGPEERD